MSFRQHNIIINVLLQHVSTQESHHQADYLRTVNTLYPLQYYTCKFCIRDPVCITICEYKTWSIIYLDKSTLCAAVGVVISAVVRRTCTSQRRGGGGVCSSLLSILLRSCLSSVY